MDKSIGIHRLKLCGVAARMYAFIEGRKAGECLWGHSVRYTNRRSSDQLAGDM
jgi:hypothetical protein